MYIYYNPNPLKLSVGDCTIRAISKVTYQTWEDTYLDLIHQGLTMYDMPSSNRVWSEYLKIRGFHKQFIPNTCPDCYTIYIDGQYGTGNSYARGGMGGNSYGMNRMGYNDSGNYDSGNSYMYYNPMYDYPMYSRRGGYSRTSSKEEVMEELKDLMRETNDDAVRNAISDAISKMNK